MSPRGCLAAKTQRVEIASGIPDLYLSGKKSEAAAAPCVVPDAGGTVVLPPAGCDYLSPAEVHMIVDGLPPGTTIELAPIHRDFICGENPANPNICPGFLPGQCEEPGGALGGKRDCFQSVLEMQMTGTGALAGFNRVIPLPAVTEVHTGPRTPGDPVQSFATEMLFVSSELLGDPDFDLLRVTGGLAAGPSPGHTTLTNLGNGTWNVDSFFDITYQIEFQGAPGSALEGFAGTTTARLRMQAGQPVAPAVPSLEGWALGVLAAALLGSAAWWVRRRHIAGVHATRV